MKIYPPKSIFQRGNETFFKNFIQVFYPVFIGKIKDPEAVANCAIDGQFPVKNGAPHLLTKTYKKDDLQIQLECSMGKGCVRIALETTGNFIIGLFYEIAFGFALGNSFQKKQYIIIFHWEKSRSEPIFQRENVNRKKLLSIWLNDKNYIFDTINELTH